MSYDNIDYSHIKLGLDNNKGRCKISTVGKPLKELLVDNSTYSGHNLKGRLFRAGLLNNQCSICGLKPVWNSQPLTMILDHINGKRTDNRIENLRIVCPNCNMQLPTTNGKNRRKISNCATCGKVVTRKSKLCRKCANSRPKVGKRKVERPTKDILRRLVETLPMTTIANQYGVTDNAVRKWCDTYQIKLPNRSGYWTKMTKTKAKPAYGTLAALVKQGLTLQQLSIMFSASPGLVSKWIKAYSIPMLSFSEHAKMCWLRRKNNNNTTGQ